MKKYFSFFHIYNLIKKTVCKKFGNYTKIVLNSISEGMIDELMNQHMASDQKLF